MSNYSYVAVNPRGMETRGMLDVSDQSEALRRIKEMGLFPTKLRAAGEGRTRAAGIRPHFDAAWKKKAPLASQCAAVPAFTACL